MSEFGKGFSYCIGLFLAHAERDYAKVIGTNGDYSLWFNGAADHLYDLVIPKKLSKVMQQAVTDWQFKCIKWRLSPCEEKDFIWAVNEAKKFLLEWDKANGIEVEKGKWE